jgi:oligopeptide transport system substrate-binding protein
MAKASRLAPLACVLILIGCGGSSSPEPPHGGAVLRLALPLVPATLDPAKAADLPSLNVVHELNGGLTRFSGRGVEPDLAESWEPSQNGLVWTFHLRKGLRWSDDAPITAEDFRRSWLRALAPSTHSAYARAEMQNIRGARRYRATGRGEVGVEAVDDRTLRVTLQHPVPWLHEQVAWPVFFPVPKSGSATSGPFRLASRTKRRLVLERNFNYWNVAAVKPRRIVLTRFPPAGDGILPRSIAAPGFPWIQTAPAPPAGFGRRLPTLSVGLLWLSTRRGALADPAARQAVAAALDRGVLAAEVGERPIRTVVPPAMPGAAELRVPPVAYRAGARPLELTLAYTPQDPRAGNLAAQIQSQLGRHHIRVTLRPVSSRMLLALAGPPSQVDLVLLGWSSEFFDEYNILDLFPCASAFNVAQWCDRSYDRSMHQAVRTLDDRERWAIERTLVQKLQQDLPAIPLYSASEHVQLRNGVRGFRWSPLGFYELLGMTRS